MKKITTLVLAVLSIFALGTLTSCKDECEDRMNNLRAELLNQNSTLRELLEAQKADLQSQINKLKEQLDAIKECTCDPNAIANLNKRLDDLQDNLGNFIENTPIKDTVDDLIKGIHDIEGQIKDLIESGAGSCKCDLTEINKRLGELEKALEGKVDKTELESIINKLNSDISSLNQRVAALETAQGKIEENIDKIEKTIKIIEETQNEHEDRITNLEATVLIIQTNITQIEKDCNAVKELLQKQIDDLESKLDNNINELQKQIDALKNHTHEGSGGYDEELRERIESLENEIEELKKLQTTVGDLKDTVNDLKDTVDGLKETLEGFQLIVNSKFVDIYDQLSDAVSRIKILEEWVKNYSGDGTCGCDLDELKTLIEQCKADAKAYTDDMIKNLVTTATLDTRLGDLKTEFKAADEALQDQITVLDAKVKDLEPRVENLENKVKNLMGLYNAIVNRLNSQISSIIVQSITTPLFIDLNLALPINVQSNVVCAYNGSVQNGETWFPSSSKSFNLSDDEDILTEEEIANFGIDETHYYQGDKLSSTGGKIYLTINPSNVNFTGAGLKLVNSQNDESGFTIENVKKSDKVLSFVSRAADNGFYEADVTLVDEGKAQFPTAPLKNAAKEVYNLVKTHTGVRDMVKAVVKAAYKSVNLPAYAVQAPYTYKDENGNDVTAYVHSNYNIAATAIHPLTYNFSGKLGDYASRIPHKKFRHIPYLSQKLQDLSAWGEIKGKLYFEFDNVDYTVKSFSFTIPSFTLDEVNLTVTVEDVKYSYEQPTGYDPVTGQFTGWETKYGYLDITVPITGNELKDIEKAIQDQILTNLKNQFEDLNVKMQDLQVSFVDAINTALENTADMINTRAEEIIDIIEGLVGKSDKYVDRINNLIDKVNNQLQNVYKRLDNIDYYLLPIMFYGNKAGDLCHMSSYESTASYVNAGYMVLYPTSYTAELLNPASKKMIKVTKAKRLSDGKNDTAEVAAANNSFVGLDQVIDGSVRSVGVQLKSGYAYEIAYSAMDYTGYQITQRYWVKVK